MATLRAIAVIAAVLIVTAALLPIHLVAFWRRWPLRKTTARLWHRAAARILGLRITTHGQPYGDATHGVLFASNHVSWLDIVVFGATAEVSFIAKDEVRTLPLFGWLARWQDSVFVARQARTATRAQADMIADRLHHGDAMVLFAEGTTTSGNFVEPFKSSLFGAVGIGAGNAENGEMTVQPVAIAYTGIDGVPMDRRERALVSWPGDVELGPHMWGILRNGCIDVDIAFGAPIVVTARTDRKQLAAEAEAAVGAMLSALLRGRDVPSTKAQNPLKTPA